MRLSHYSLLMALICCSILLSAVVIAQNATDNPADVALVQDHVLYELVATADDFIDDVAVVNAFLGQAVINNNNDVNAKAKADRTDIEGDVDAAEISPQDHTVTVTAIGSGSTTDTNPSSSLTLDGLLGQGNFDEWFDKDFDGDVSVTASTSFPSTPCEVVVKCPASKLTASLETIIVGIKLTGYTLQNTKSLPIRLTSDDSNKQFSPFSTKIVSDGTSGAIFILAFFSRVEIGQVTLVGVNIIVSGLISPPLNHPKLPGCATSGCSQAGTHDLCKIAYKLFIIRASLKIQPFTLPKLEIAIICTSKTIAFKCAIPCGPVLPPSDGECSLECSYDNLPALKGDSLIACCKKDHFYHFDPNYCCNQGCDEQFGERCKDHCFIHNTDDCDVQDRFKKCCRDINRNADVWKLRECCSVSGVTPSTLYCCEKPAIFDELCIGDQKECCRLTGASDRHSDCCDPSTDVFQSLLATDPTWIKQNCCSKSAAWPDQYKDLCKPVCTMTSFISSNPDHIKACCNDVTYHPELCCKHRGSNSIPYHHEKCCTLAHADWVNPGYCCKPRQALGSTVQIYYPEICCKDKIHGVDLNPSHFDKSRCCSKSHDEWPHFTGFNDHVTSNDGDNEDIQDGNRHGPGGAHDDHRCHPNCDPNDRSEWGRSCCKRITNSNQKDCCKFPSTFTQEGCCKKDNRGQYTGENWNGNEDTRCAPDCTPGSNYDHKRCCDDVATFSPEHCCKDEDCQSDDRRHALCCGNKDYWDSHEDECCSVANNHSPHFPSGGTLNECCVSSDFYDAHLSLCCTGATEACCKNQGFFSSAGDIIKAECCIMGYLPASSNKNEICCQFGAYFELEENKGTCCNALQYPLTQKEECCEFNPFFQAGDNTSFCCCQNTFPVPDGQARCCGLDFYFDEHPSQCCDPAAPSEQCCQSAEFFSASAQAQEQCCLMGVLPDGVSIGGVCCTIANYFNTPGKAEQCCTLNTPAYPGEAPEVCCEVDRFYSKHHDICCDLKDPNEQCCRDPSIFEHLGDEAKTHCCSNNWSPADSNECCTNSVYFNYPGNKAKCCDATVFPGGSEAVCCALSSYFNAHKDSCCDLKTLPTDTSRLLTEQAHEHCCRYSQVFFNTPHLQGQCCIHDHIPIGDDNKKKCCRNAEWFFSQDVYDDDKDKCCKWGTIPLLPVLTTTNSVATGEGDTEAVPIADLTSQRGDHGEDGIENEDGSESEDDSSYISPFYPHAVKFCCRRPGLANKPIRCPCSCKEGCKRPIIQIVKDKNGKIDAHVSVDGDDVSIDAKATDAPMLLDLIKAKLSEYTEIPEELTISLKSDTFYVLGAENLRDDVVQTHDDEF